MKSDENKKKGKSKWQKQIRKEIQLLNETEKKKRWKDIKEQK